MFKVLVETAEVGALGFGHESRIFRVREREYVSKISNDPAYSTTEKSRGYRCRKFALPRMAVRGIVGENDGANKARSF